MSTLTDNDEKSKIDGGYNRGSGSYDPRSVQNAEQSYIQRGINEAEAFANNPSNSLKDQEETNTASGGNMNYTGTGGGKQKVSGKAWFQKKGPLSAISVLILGGGVGISFLGSFASLPVYVKEMLVQKYNAQNTSLTVRERKVIARKIVGDTTSGVCGSKITIACKFSRPSTELLANLEKDGVTALDKAGQPISKNKLFPNERPDSYDFIDSSGTKNNFKAPQFATALDDNLELRTAFHRAYNPEFVGFSDSIFKKVAARFGFSKSNDLADVKDEASAKTKIDEKTKGQETGAKAAAAEGSTAAENTTKDLLEKELDKSIAKVGKTGKGNAAGLAAAVTCMVGDAPGLVTKTVRTYQMTQLILYASIFLTAADAIKAGKATPEQIAVIGGLLTASVKGQSAMDSFGMKYTLFGDTKAAKDDSYKKFSPGASAISDLAPITQITSSQAKKEACAVATNPATGVAIDSATSETIIGPLINVAVGVVAGYALEQVAPLLAKGITDMLVSTHVIDNILKFFVGDLTQNLSGQDVGNALAGGASNMMGQTANAGGNMPLTVDQAIAYNRTTQDVQLAYAEEDRATLSPFDTSSPNTMLGSIVRKIAPYTAQVGSLSGILSTIGSIASSPLNFFSVAHATSDTAQYTGCDDPAIIDAKIAAGPFCNIQYGIPPEYLNKDPIDVLNSLGNANVDPETGEPVKDSDLDKWLTLCTDGSTDQMADCMIKDQKTADYALYTIDHRVQKTMDGEDALN